MDKLLALTIPSPFCFFLWAFLGAAAVRAYISLIEGWTRGWEWFWPVFTGVGVARDDGTVGGDRLTGLVIGFIEAVSYPLLMKAGLPEYIGAWLAFKTVNRWGYKQQDRGMFNRYLVANGLLLVLGYLLARFAL